MRASCEQTNICWVLIVSVCVSCSVPCATVLVRILPAARSGDGRVLTLADVADPTQREQLGKCKFYPFASFFC